MAPSELSGTSFNSISPGLNQIFFIGDGLTGTGTGEVQTFYVPTGATRLFLGVIDDGGYYDNRGQIDATITPRISSVAAGVPEPTTWAMMILGIGAIGLAMRRKSVTSHLAHQV